MRKWAQMAVWAARHGSTLRAPPYPSPPLPPPPPCCTREAPAFAPLQLAGHIGYAEVSGLHLLTRRKYACCSLAGSEGIAWTQQVQVNARLSRWCAGTPCKPNVSLAPMRAMFCGNIDGCAHICTPCRSRNASLHLHPMWLRRLPLPALRLAGSGKLLAWGIFAGLDCLRSINQ